MTADLVLRSDAVLIDGCLRAAAVVVENGRIIQISARDEPVDAEKDHRLPTGHVLLPGLVDTHVHVNEPGRTDWEGFASATLAAAAGGVTTIIDMPLNSIPPTTTVPALELKRLAAGVSAAVNVGFWGGVIPENLGSLEKLSNAGVFGFKAFLSPSGVDEFPHLNLEQLYAAGREIASFNGLLIVHAEDPAVLDEHTNGGGVSYRDFAASRPASAEQAAIHNVIDVVRATGVRAHILHLSSAAALPELRAARAEGLPITVETCPHYLSFSAEAIADGATVYKCCPPIRDESNRAQLWQGLEDGVIDLIASDHSPSTKELKIGHNGDFGQAWGGISGLQLSLSAVWTAARARGVRLESVVGWMAESTARFVDLPAKGRIRVGADADLMVFDPNDTFIANAQTLRHKNKVSAFDGAALTGRVTQTWLAGHLIFRSDSAEAFAHRGALLARHVKEQH
jgi:allantoinase